jgi:hypothetical protein
MGLDDGNHHDLLDLGNSLCGDSLFLLNSPKGQKGDGLEQVGRGQEGHVRGEVQGFGGLGEVHDSAVAKNGLAGREGQGRPMLSDRCFEVFFGANSFQAI